MPFSTSCGRNYAQTSPVYAIPLLFALVLCFFPLIDASYDGESFDGNLLDKVSGFPCTRLFSSGDSLGCGSPDKSGSTGVLFAVRNDKDLRKSGDLTVDFVAVMAMDMMNDTTLDLLRSRGMKGVMVLPESGSG